MFLCSPVPQALYTDEYTSVAIPGLLDIDTNPMIRHLGLIQFLEEAGVRDGLGRSFTFGGVRAL